MNTREGAIPARLVFKVEISGDAARVVGPMARSAPLVHDGRAARVETAVTLRNATPWSPDTPVLYTLVAKLERDGQEIDRLVSQFGVRTIVARGRQLLLNGRALKIKGVNRYDEYGGFGPNPPQALLEDELRLMKQAGVNLIRSHYPQSPEFLSLCDRSGILFLAELPINWWGVEWFGKDDVVQDEKILDRARPDARNDDPQRQKPPLRDHLERGQRIEDRERDRNQSHAARSSVEPESSIPHAWSHSLPPRGPSATTGRLRRPTSWQRTCTTAR